MQGKLHVFRIGLCTHLSYVSGFSIQIMEVTGVQFIFCFLFVCLFSSVETTFKHKHLPLMGKKSGDRKCRLMTDIYKPASCHTLSFSKSAVKINYFLFILPCVCLLITSTCCRISFSNFIHHICIFSLFIQKAKAALMFYDIYCVFIWLQIDCNAFRFSLNAFCCHLGIFI